MSNGDPQAIAAAMVAKGWQTERSDPMTLRDELAMRATDQDISDVIGNVFDHYHLARILGISFESVRDDYYGSRFKARIKARYIWADAMLAERDKT